MAIAKGRTDCKAERDLVLQGFREQLQILADSQNEQEDLVKARLFDLITDRTLSDEEKYTLKRPWSDHLHELEERHIRIRRSVFIGLYSFWEVSLMNIANTHIPAMVENARKSKKSKNLGASDYLKMIYGGKLPSLVNLIDNNIREFRNYLVHGTLTEERESLISTLANSHTEFCIRGISKTYFIDNYKGVSEILMLFSKELENADNEILKIKITK